MSSFLRFCNAIAVEIIDKVWGCPFEMRFHPTVLHLLLVALT
ncbi:MAG: hypothetical protein RR241_05565 [Raoultibacter sp.]